jgi:hypothetical protein
MSKTKDKETEQAFRDTADAVDKRCELIRAALKEAISLRSKLDKPANRKMINQMALTLCLAEVICEQRQVNDALHAAIDLLEHYVLGPDATVEADPSQVH